MTTSERALLLAARLRNVYRDLSAIEEELASLGYDTTEKKQELMEEASDRRLSDAKQ